MTNVFVVDNFHPKPYELREFALKQDFNVDGNYPGHRTRSFLKDSDYPIGLIPFPPPADYVSTTSASNCCIVET